MNNKLGLQGTYEFSIIGTDGKVRDSWTQKNIVVDEGKNHTLSVTLAGGVQNSTWYIGIYLNNYTPVASDTMATFPTSGVANEAVTEYSEVTRPTFSGVLSGNQIDNGTSLAQFTFASAATIYGAFLSSDSTKGGTTGTLFSAGQFTTAKTLAIGEILQVKYTIQIA